MHPRPRSCSRLIVTTQCTRHTSCVSIRLRAGNSQRNSPGGMAGAKVEGSVAPDRKAKVHAQ